MQAKLIINGVDFIPFIVEGGIEQTDVERYTVQVVTINGNMHRRCVRRRAIDISLRELRDEVIFRLFSTLKPDMVSVTYTDIESGADRTGVFHVMNRSAGLRVIKGGNTYCAGGKFRLEAL